MLEKLTWTEVNCLSYGSLPDVEGVYMFKSNDKVLYVGRSNRISGRFIGHRKFIEVLMEEYGEITFCFAETLNSSTAEKELILKYNPKHNGNARQKDISFITSRIKEALDGRKMRWLSFEVRISEADLSKKMTGKMPFTEDELSRIERRLNFKIFEGEKIIAD
jgi:predicted GIY-YIG superfamily endonuclease